jgi:hypothetical protein
MHRVQIKPAVKQTAISAFLLFHIAAITSWCLPGDSALLVKCRDVFRPYMLLSGLFQGWDMFAPTPKNINGYVEAAIVLNDGQVRAFRFPRMEQLGFGERYYRERYRKFVENLREDKNSALWPDAARYIARRNASPANPPKFVILIRYWSDIVPRDSKTAPRREDLRAHIFFEYSVKPEDLQ